MQLRTRFDQRALVHTAELSWVNSPVAGVQRRMIERDGGERARATSLVRYAPGSRFGTHAHPLGEEVLVLDGEFTDESGSYSISKSFLTLLLSLAVLQHCLRPRA